MKLKLDKVKYYVHFVGSSRSGHTLVSQILNAHKDVVISNEINTVSKMLSKHHKNRIPRSIYNNSVNFAKSGSKWTEYDYSIPGQWQGKTTEPIIIGDKFAASVLHLNQKVIKSFFNYVVYPVKFIHVTRNYRDQVKSMVKMSGHSYQDMDKRHSDQLYMSRVIIDKYDGIEIKLEMLKEMPDVIIKALCKFLEIDCPDDYLAACCGLVR